MDDKRPEDSKGDGRQNERPHIGFDAAAGLVVLCLVPLLFLLVFQI